MSELRKVKILLNFGKSKVWFGLVLKAKSLTRFGSSKSRLGHIANYYYNLLLGTEIRFQPRQV